MKGYVGEALNEVKDNLITELRQQKSSLKQKNFETEE